MCIRYKPYLDVSQFCRTRIISLSRISPSCLFEKYKLSNQIDTHTSALKMMQLIRQIRNDISIKKGIIISFQQHEHLSQHEHLWDTGKCKIPYRPCMHGQPLSSIQLKQKSSYILHFPYPRAILGKPSLTFFFLIINSHRHSLPIFMCSTMDSQVKKKPSSTSPSS